MTNLKIEVIPKGELSEVDRAVIIALCTQAFEEDYTPYLTAFRDSVHILARLRGELICHACWITRYLQVGNGPLLCTAYVEGVATDEVYRGKGYATAVMERLASEISSFDIGALSPAETTLYARLGWQYWQGPLFHRKGKALIPDPQDEEVMVFQLSKTPDLDLRLPISVEWRQGEVW